MAELITVCAACRRQSCWNGTFYCEDYRTAGTIDIPATGDERTKERAAFLERIAHLEKERDAILDEVALKSACIKGIGEERSSRYGAADEELHAALPKGWTHSVIETQPPLPRLFSARLETPFGAFRAESKASPEMAVALALLKALTR